MTQKVGEETFILVIQITSSLCLSLFRLSIDISHYIFGFFQTDREEDKCFYMGDKLAHQKALNKEWNNCTLGYMFRRMAEHYKFWLLPTYRLDDGWALCRYIRYGYSITQLKWLSENCLTRFKAKKMAEKMAPINGTLSSTHLSFTLFLTSIHKFSYKKWIKTRSFYKCSWFSLKH